MTDLADGEMIEVRGSARDPYVLRNVGGVYSCTCPAWRNQSAPIERRTCKHLRALRGEAAERERLGSDSLAPAGQIKEAKESSAPALLLAHSWQNDRDLAGWHMSEKLDGVRAWWDGKSLISRLGNRFHAPEWFVAGLPETPLDGELWIGRKAFQRTVSVVRRQDQSDHWREVRYVVFDMPAVDAPFEERMAALRDALASQPPPFATIHEHAACRGLAHLREELERVESLGGEGLMLRQPGSRYEAGRSTTLLKVKTFHDAEATVVEHVPGAGRHKGRLGALAATLADGTSFSIGTGFSDAQRERPPAIGSLVTFRYQELSDRGVPRFPSFVRVRREGPEGETVMVDVSPSGKGAGKKKATSSAQASAEGKGKAAPAAEKPQAKTASAAAAAAAGSATSSNDAGTRRFEFVDAKSAKFWEITVDGTDVTVRFGRLETQGQTQTKNFADAAAARKHADKLIAEKTAKGYVESVGSGK